MTSADHNYSLQLSTDTADHSYSIQSAIICPNEERGSVTEHLDKTICRFLVEQNVPGATLAIARHGRIVYEQGYGAAGAGRRMNASMALRVASISKPVTAITLLRLCQEGRLSLDARVFGVNGILKKYRAQGDKRLSKVTVRHLLQHSAGWDRDMVGDAVFWKVTPPPGVDMTSPQYNAHLLQYVLNRKLQFTPGSRFAYSNLGYLVLGEVIEAVTGESYENIVKSVVSHIGVNKMYVGDESRVKWQSEESEYFNIREPATARSILPEQEGSLVLPQYGSFLMRNTGAFGGWVAKACDILNIMCNLQVKHYQTFKSCQATDDHFCNSDSSAVVNQQQSHPGTLLTSETVDAMMERPSFESGRDWYGLGLDVQDWGDTWGHTGAMEGTCGTVQCHRSGISWAFLLNAWAKDADLDGVVKLALSLADGLSPFAQGIAKVHEGSVHVTTKDESQSIAVNVPCEKVWLEIEEKCRHGLELMWAGVNSAQQSLEGSPTFNMIFCKCKKTERRKLLINIDIQQLQAVFEQYRAEGFRMDFVTTYKSGCNILGMAIVSRSNENSKQELNVAIPAKEYVQLLAKKRKCGLVVLSQCVTQWKSELLVTAIMERKEHCDVLFNCRYRIESESKIRQSMKRKSSFSVQKDQLPLPALGSSCFTETSKCLQTSNLIDTGNEHLPLCHQSQASIQLEMSDSVSLTQPSKMLLSGKYRTKPRARARQRTLSWVQMTIESFASEIGRQARHSSGLQQVNFYPAFGEWFVSGVWSPHIARNCFHRMGVSQLGLLPALAEAATGNVHLKCLGQYEEEGTLYYALFWEAHAEL